MISSQPDAHTTGRRVGPHGEVVVFAGPPEEGVSSARRLLNLVEFASDARKIAREFEFDVVVSDPPPTAASAALSIAKHGGVPFVYYLADSWGGAARGSRRSWIRALAPAISFVEDRALIQASLVVAATEGMARVARRARARNVQVVRNGVPIDVFTPTGDTWWPSDLRRPFFLYAGNAGVVHGAEVFCTAADTLWREGLEFDVIYMGYGSDAPLIDAAAARWPDRLIRLGIRPVEEVAAASRTAIGALTSLREVPQYADARPIKAMSGLASGTPLVYAGQGEFASEIERNHIGFVSIWDANEVGVSMRAALVAAADSEGFSALRVRCAAYARANFDDRRTASVAAKLVIDVANAAITD